VWCLVTSCADERPLVLARQSHAEIDRNLSLLLGIDAYVARALPADAPVDLFDNNAAQLAVSADFVERLEPGLESAVDAAFARNVPIAGVDAGRCPGTAYSCARTFVVNFGARAWQGKVPDGEVERLVGLMRAFEADGSSGVEVLRAAAVAILLSPRFLSRAAPLSSPATYAPEAIATRLAGALWGSLADEALREAAADGSLDDTATRAAHVDRMLADPRAAGLVDDFAAQWLSLRQMETIAAANGLEAVLAADMREEARRLVANVLARDLDARVLLTADETELSAALAAHYGLPASGDDWMRASLATTPRRGLLGMAGFHAWTTSGDRTSPSRRGNWVLERFLCLGADAPPPGIPPISESPGPTARDRLAVHARSAECASCHLRMDPIGLGLEQFDGTGRFRATENDATIDPSGTLFGAARFDGPVTLAAALRDAPTLPACVARHAATWMFRGAPTPSQAPVLDDVVTRWTASGLGFRRLFALLATSSLATEVPVEARVSP